MKQIYKIDAKGFVSEIYISREIDGNLFVLTGYDNEKEVWEKRSREGFVFDAPTKSYYKAKRVHDAWVEGATPAEIDAIKNRQTAPSVEEKLALMQAALDEMILGGGGL